MEDDLKILKVEYPSNHCMDNLRGEIEKNSEEISSVALLSPACLIFFVNGVKHQTETKLVECLIIFFNSTFMSNVINKQPSFPPIFVLYF